MRRRLLISLLGSTAVILLVVLVPVGILVSETIREEAGARLRSVGAGILAHANQELDRDDRLDPGRLARPMPAGLSARVITSGGTVDLGPPAPAKAFRIQVDEAGETVILSESSAIVDGRSHRAWGILAIIGSGGLAIAGVVAVVLARRLARPLDTLAVQAERLGAGDFSVTVPKRGISEIDRVGTALDASAARIRSLIESERRFSTHATHQLRTALTVLRLRLEEAYLRAPEVSRDDFEEAIARADALGDTITSMLALSRTGRAGAAAHFDLAELARAHGGDHAMELRRSGRNLHIEADDSVHVWASPGAVGEALDILLSNAARHGAGTITMEVHRIDDEAMVTIFDEGGGVQRDLDALFVPAALGEEHGVGLALARELIEAEGGNLRLRDARTARFELRIPCEDLTKH